MAHMLPEVHGCGADVRAAARSQAARDGRHVLAGGILIRAAGESASGKAHHALLEKKLKKTLNTKAAARAANIPAKDGAGPAGGSSAGAGRSKKAKWIYKIILLYIYIFHTNTADH
jgi:hypothetical protein